jgi:enterochelin esterase-like enzyme
MRRVVVTIGHFKMKHPLALLTALMLAPLVAFAQKAPAWVLPEINAPRVQRVLFESKAVGRQVSCHIFTPEVYERGKEQRFPVVYWLHGTGGGLPGVAPVSARFDAAIREGKIPPMLVVFPNGLATSMWCDAKDGSVPMETIVIKELIPHIDTTFRTIAKREGRIVEGFSMGGYGAARLGFKYPQLFGAVSVLAGGPLDLDFAGPRATGNPAERERILNSTFGDLDYYRAVHPIAVAQQQAENLRGNVRVRIAVGALDNTEPLNRAYSEHLKKLNIAHTFTVVPGVGHDTLALLKGLSEANWEFYRSLSGNGPTANVVTKPEVANAAKAARRAWESAPAEKKALWQQQRDALTHIDLSEDTKRQVIIARGSPKPDEYHAHPTTAMLADHKTMFCVWNLGHGGHAGPMARSEDAGLTWKRIDDALPPNYVNFKNCPSLYRVTDPQGKERLWVFAARTLTDKENPKLIEGRHEGFMPRIVSEDEGKTWRELPPIGGRISKDDPFRCIMTFSSIVRLKDGSHLGMFHRGSGIGEEGTLQVLQSVTRDGGFTWSEPTMACDGTQLDGKHPCEPYVFRSPDGNELCCLMRENKRSGTSLVMFSSDEGKTWSQAVDAPWGLTGDRHHGVTLPDGRMVIVFRNATPQSKDKAGFIAWVGTYDDIKQGKPGQYRVSLLKTFKDGFYPGIHLLPEGTIVATTYANYRKEDVGCSIVSVRFKMDEIVALAAKDSI